MPVVVHDSSEELFPEELLRSFNSVSVLDDHGGEFSTNVSVLAALAPSLCPLLTEGLREAKEIQVILGGYSIETLNQLDKILHRGEVVISDVQRRTQAVSELKRDLRSLGVNPPEDFWTLTRYQPQVFERSDKNLPLDDFKSIDNDRDDNEVQPFTSFALNGKQEHSATNYSFTEDTLWVKHNKERGKPMYCCLVCDKFYFCTSSLNHHLVLHHPDLSVNLMTLFECKECSK